MRTIIFKKEQDQRLDAYLQETYTSLNFSKLNKFLRENKIKVNKEKVPLNTHLKYGDIITLYIKDEVLDFVPSYTLDVAYEDDNILIANKPSGLVVENYEDEEKDSLILRARKYVQQKESCNYLELCHRLDTGTSGLVIMAKNEETLGVMEILIKNHKITKEYLCVVVGCPKEKSGTIKSYLRKNPITGVVKSYNAQVKDSKEAISEYCVKEEGKNYSVVNVKLQTGRTHQIRVHMADLGCPIVGDSKYGKNAINKKLKTKRQLLCAYKLKFPDLDGKYSNLSKKVIEIKTPIEYSAFAKY